MARARNIKPGFFKNEDLAECSPWARLCFAGLWTLADREGRLEDRPKRIKGELFAFDTVDVDPLLGELEKYGFIMRYEAEGIRVIQILKFDLHQHPHHKEPSSDLPSPKSPGFCGHESVKQGVGTGPITESLLLNPESRDRETHTMPDLAPEPPAVDRIAPDGAARVDPDPASPPLPQSPKPEQPSPEGPEPTPPPSATPPDRPPPTSTPVPTPAAAACRAMRAAGLASVNPSSPELAALLDAGATVDALADAADLAARRGKGFAYALGVVRGQMADAASIAAGGLAGTPPARASPPEPAWRTEQRQRTLQAVPGIAAKSLTPSPKKFIETGAEHVVAIAVG